MTMSGRQGYHEAMTRYIRGKLAARNALAIALCASPATAQDWPSRTVKIIVPFGAGSTPDIIMRLIAERLQQKLGQPFLIENKPGASGMTGTDAVAKAAPDGSTIGISIGGPLALNTMLFGKMPYDPGKDLALITLLTSQPSALVVNSNIKVNSAGELMALLKREHGKFNFGSIGDGLALASRDGGYRARERDQHGARPIPWFPCRNDCDHPWGRANGLPACDRGNSSRRLRRGENSCRYDREAFALFAGHSNAQRKRNRRRS